MNRTGEHTRGSAGLGRDAVSRLVDGVRCAAFWITAAFAVVWPVLLVASQDALAIEVVGGLLGVHGTALVLGYSHNRPASRVPGEHRGHDPPAGREGR